MRVPAILHRVGARIRALPWPRFGAGVVAGAGGLLVTFILRAYSLGVFLPEVAVNFVVDHIPGNVESFFISAMGGGAKVLALAIALLVFLVLPGIYAAFYRRIERLLPNRWLGIPRRWLMIAVYTFGTAGLALLVILPLLDGYFFGANTRQGAWAASFSQLVGAWLYAAVLDYFLVDYAASHLRGFERSRRNLFKWGAIASVVAVLTFYGLARFLPKVGRLAFASVAEMFAKEVTPNDEFYVVSKNVGDPVIDEAAWRLTVDGLVDAPATYAIGDLRGMAAFDEHVTLECVSNEVGGNLISTAKWSGLVLSDLIDRSVVQAGADWVAFTCDGDGYTVGIPLAKVREGTTLLALAMNGEPLAVAHGHPARIVVPGRFGMFSAKWVTRITLVRGEFLGFWQRKGWTNDGRIRTTAIIATPPADSVVGGSVTIGGVAFAGDRGIQAVEVSTDGGATWTAATLKRPPLSGLTWVLWSHPWTPPAGGSYRIVARAVDGTPAPQQGSPEPPYPNGAAGYDTITLLVSA